LGDVPRPRTPVDAARPGEAATDHDPRRPRLAAEALRRRPSLGPEGAIAVAQVILEEASASGLDPVLVLAIITVESAWETQAVSTRGARGLMQLRGETQAGEERDAGLAPGDPHDPVHNIRMGVRYYGRMVETFGDPDLALVAYNAGPTRLASYLQAVGEVPDSLWSYARRVRREERRLRRGMGLGRDEVLASLGAN
jgi:soluble lytic murein transglycosylase